LAISSGALSSHENGRPCNSIRPAAHGGAAISSASSSNCMSSSSSSSRGSSHSTVVGGSLGLTHTAGAAAVDGAPASSGACGPPFVEEPLGCMLVRAEDLAAQIAVQLGEMNVVEEEGPSGDGCGDCGLKDGKAALQCPLVASPTTPPLVGRRRVAADAPPPAERTHTGAAWPYERVQRTGAEVV
jgi:hypothetical protein